MKRYLFWFLPGMWMVVIFLLSSQPYQQQNIQPFLKENVNLSSTKKYVENIKVNYRESEVSVASHGLEGFFEFFIRKGAHFIVFFMLLLFFYFAFKKTTDLTFRSQLILSFILTSGYAVLDEVHQSFTPNRTPFVGDVLIDISGALFGVVIIFTHFMIKKRQSPS